MQWLMPMGDVGPPAVAGLLAFGRERLAAAGVAAASRDAARLLAGVLGVETAGLYLDPGRPVGEAEERLFGAWVERRCRREPLQYILERTEFMGLPFRVDSRVLIPRPETERLVEAVLEELEACRPISPPVSAPVSPLAGDLGTGSGCIAVSLAALRPELRVRAFDLSPGALEVARGNAAANGVAERIEFRPADILAPGFSPGDGFIALVSNPPYVAEEEIGALQEEVRDYEPRMALVAPGEDAYVFYRRLGELASAALAPEGFLAVEVGAGMAGETASIFEERGLRIRRFVDDYGGHRRVVLAGRRW